MSQYPVQTQQGLYQAVNYLLSGPSGLGQNFAGFSAYQTAYVRGTYTRPFTISSTLTNYPPSWTTAPIAITTGSVLNVSNPTSATNYIQLSFTPQSYPPFLVGDTVLVSNVIDSPYTDNWNGYFNSGVLSVSTNTVILSTPSTYSYGHITNLSSATIQKNNLNTFISTDANARVTVTGPSQLIAITSQLSLQFTYTCTTASQFDLVIAVNRYVPTTTAPLPAGVDYTFAFDKTISQQVSTFTSTSSGTINLGSTIFSTVLDTPGFGYYWYITEISFNNVSQTGTTYIGNAAPGIMAIGLRSLTAQVIKE